MNTVNLDILISLIAFIWILINSDSVPHSYNDCKSSTN